MNHSPVPAHRYIQRETLLGCAINAAIALFFAALLFHNAPVIPLWGSKGIAIDLVPTVFMLTLFGSLAISLLTRQRLRQGRIAPPHNHPSSWIAALASLPLPVRTVIVALLMTVALVPLTCLALMTLAVDALAFWPFVAFKMGYAAIVGALSAPWILKAALAVSDRAPA
ncbi:hypothetical protein LZ023_19705 [Pseudomonas silvicola]|nr:hypothetical protein LZ023_19705 [Pseudomonas silvicola]